MVDDCFEVEIDLPDFEIEIGDDFSVEIEIEEFEVEVC